MTDRPQLRVTHAPVNIAGIPWENVQALRRKGVDARLVVFERGTLHHEADWSLDRHGPLPQRLAQQFAAFGKLAPRTDVFHFYFGLTLVPKSVQFPLLRALRKKSVFHYLGSDIRGKSRAELAYGERADAEIVGSYDAVRWVPHAHVIPPGLDLRPFTPVPPSDSPRPLVVHAPSNREKKGTAQVVAALEQLPVELDIVEGVPHEEARARYARADIVVDQLNAGWHGVFALEAMALGKPVVTYLKPDVVEKSAAGYGIRIPIVPATADTLAEAIAPLVESPALPARDRRREPRLRRAGPRHRPCRRPPARRLPFALDRVARLPDPAARPPLGDLRPRRDPLAHPRRPAAPPVHVVPRDAGLREDRARHRADDGARDRAAAPASRARSSASTSTRRRRRTARWWSAPRSGSRWRWRRSGCLRASRSRRRSRTRSGSGTTPGSCAPPPSGCGRR